MIAKHDTDSRIAVPLAELRELDLEEESNGRQLARRRARATRALIEGAGGVKAAAAILGLDPRTVSRRTRLDDIAIVIYRNTAGVDVDGRPYGETGQSGAVQREADARWWRVDPKQRPKVKLLVVVFRGEVTRIWRVQPDKPWTPKPGDPHYVEIPVETTPLTAEEVAHHYPELGLNLGDSRPMRQGLIREDLPLSRPDEPKGQA
ncbi:hypothetical protein ACWD26_29515 [Streptomyces sp. NPDC002787]